MTLASSGAMNSAPRETIKVLLPIYVPSVSNLREPRWEKANRTHRHRGIARLVLQARQVKTLLPCEVLLTRLGPKELDDDNWVGAAKAVRDGVADAFGVSDRDPRITWRYAQKQQPSYAVEIEVTRSE
jgi:hypothetical protein